jgi:hypothetical protein
MADDGVGPTVAQDQHYVPRELAKLWHTSPNTIRRLFRDEPGVILIEPPTPKKPRKRRLIQMRIPVSVAQRVHAKLSKVA